MQSKRIQVLHYPPGTSPQDLEIVSSLEAMQQIVGGLIEVICLPELGPDVALIANEEARLSGMSWNRTTDSFPIAGPFFAVGDTSHGEFRSLTTEERNRVMRYFAGRELRGKSFPPRGSVVMFGPGDCAYPAYQDAAALAIQQHLALDEFEHLYFATGFEPNQANRLVEAVVRFIRRYHAIPNSTEFAVLLAGATTS